MAFLRRTKRTPPPSATHPVTAFWQWWSTTGHSLSPHEPGPHLDELTARVVAIHPDLTWHFGPGHEAEHRLTLSAAGSPVARTAAARWHRAARPDATWEFAPSAAPDPDALTHSIEIGGAILDLSEVTLDVEVDEAQQRVHVGLHHPGFAGLDEAVRAQVTFLVLDWIVGEDAVERWVGVLEPLTNPPSDPVQPEVLRDVVDGLVAGRDPQGWALLEGERDGTPVLATVRSGLRWLDLPAFDRHQLVAVAYDPDERGLPSAPDTLDKVAAFEDELTEAVGAAGVYLGRELSDGVVVFHAYTDGEDQNAEDRVRRLAERRKVHLQSGDDPSWQEVRHLTG